MAPRQLPVDFKEFIQCLNNHNVKYLLDIINHADGISVADCYTRRKIIKIEGIDISVISRADLIINKSSSGRLRDMADVEYLENI